MLFILADNQDITRLGLTSLIKPIPDTEILEVSERSRLLSLLARVESAIVVLDYTLFDFPDADALIAVSQRYPRVRWILFSDELTDDFMRRITAESASFSLLGKGSDMAEADTALRLLTSVNEVMEEGRYIAAGDEETINENMAKAQELEGAITKVIELVTELVEDVQNNQMDYQDQAEARIMETKDTMIDSATEAITSFAEIASNLVYVVTGVADSNARTRGIPGAENEIPEVAEAANKLQDFLSDLVYFLSTLKDTEPVAVE